MITNYMLYYTDPFWLLASVAELTLLALFIRPLERKPLLRCGEIASAFALFALWHGIHLLHFDFVFDFLLNIAAVTAYLAITRKTTNLQPLYIACVFLLCSEIGKIITVDLFMQPLYDVLSPLPAMAVTSIWIALYVAFDAVALFVVSRWTFCEGMGGLSWSQSLFILLPLIPYTYIRTSGYVYDSTNHTLYQDMVLVLILLSICTVAIIVANAHNLSAQIQRNELLRMQALLREQHMQYVAGKSAVDAVNRRYHDLKQYVSKIEALDGGSAATRSDIERFAAAVKQEIEPLSCEMQTGNEVLDILLTEKRRICLKHDIRPAFYVDGSKLGFMNSFDLCAIVGNAVDNAIEATQKLPADEVKDIGLTIAYSNDLAVIQCRNRFVGRIAPSESSMSTTKPDVENHGFGIKSMRLTAESYGGYLSWNATGDEFALTVMIPITREARSADTHIQHDREHPL